MVQRNWFLLSLLIGFSILSLPAFCQGSLSGEIRVRPEFRNGYKSLSSASDDPAFFISQRSRVKLDYGSEKFRFFLSAQDVRTWGSTPQLNLSDGFLSIHEAWGEVIFSDQINLKAGRQELVYDNQRILGNVDWAQQGRSHDLLLLRVGTDRLSWHTGLAFNQDKEQLTTTHYSVPGNYKSMQFTWLHRESGGLQWSILALNNGLQAPDSSVNYSQTVGSYLTADIWKISAALSGYYQMGKDVSGRKISAGYFFTEASMPVSEGIITRLGFEFLSGTDQINISNQNSFLPLYGTNHKFNGYMDYFYVGNHSSSVGLRDAYAGLSCKWKRLDFLATAHLFSSAHIITDPVDIGIILKNYLGTEADFTLSWKYSENVTLSGGYSRMFATVSMQALKGGDYTSGNSWAWMMLILKPEFLNF